MKKAAIAILVPVVAFSTMYFAQTRIDAMRSHEFDEQLLYLPNQDLLQHCTAGMNSVVADLLWLRCIQYTSQQFRGDFKFTWLDQMCRTITQLDPYFVAVYQWGGVFLAMLKHDNDASVELLKSGIPQNPTRWELPFEIARTYVLNRHDNVRGARYLAIAAATGNPPPFVVDWAKNLQKQHGLYDVERGMWQDILSTSGDKNMRTVAERKLQELSLRETCDVLNKLADEYQKKTGKRPASIEEFESAGLVRGIGNDPLGGHFFVDSRGVVQNTSVLDSMKEERLQILRGWVSSFRERTGRWPKTLEELVDGKHLHALPTHPFEGKSWEYDPATGDVK
ncbi:MAG: hypothetical protein K1Y02_11375 [Candidatus Hydrogenedentes bacterium]|nr:hypothetical protein [Candidatus Hydrogenedentota bacterium]